MSISRELSKFIEPGGQLEYDNTTSGLSATTVKSAIDELNTLLGGGNVGSQATFNVYEFTATAAQTTFSLSSNHGQGSDITAGAFADGVVYIITAVGTTDFVALYGASSNTVGVTFTATTDPGTGTGTAKVVADYIPGYIKVYLNGVFLSETDYVASDGDNIVLDTGADVGALLSVVVLDSFNTATQLRVLGVDAGAPDNSLVVNSSGNVGVAGSVTADGLTVETSADPALITLRHTGNTSGLIIKNFSGGEAQLVNVDSGPMVFKTNDTEAMRIDPSGNLMVGVTSAGADGGVTLSTTGYIQARIDNDTVAYFDRTGAGDDGEVIRIQQNGTTVGSISSRAGVVSTIILDPRANGAGLTGSTNGLIPVDQTGSTANDHVDLGSLTSAFRNLYLSGSANIGGNINNYVPTNSGNPEFSIGSSATNRLFVQSVYNSGAQVLNYTVFRTFTSSSNANAGRIVFAVDEADKLEINDGGIAVTGGIAFGDAGGSGTPTSNTLDSYEEGTWTPTITNSTGAYNFQIGRYTKIGNLVYVTCNLKTPFTNTGTTLQDIGGLPFVSENVANLFNVGTIFPVSGFNQANSDLAAQISINNTVVALYTVAPTTGINYTGVTSNTFGTSVEFEFSACYRTA